MSNRSDAARPGCPSEPTHSRFNHTRIPGLNPRPTRAVNSTGLSIAAATGNASAVTWVRCGQAVSVHGINHRDAAIALCVGIDAASITPSANAPSSHITRLRVGSRLISRPTRTPASSCCARATVACAIAAVAAGWAYFSGDNPNSNELVNNPDNRGNINSTRSANALRLGPNRHAATSRLINQPSPKVNNANPTTPRNHPGNRSPKSITPKSTNTGNATAAACANR